MLLRASISQKAEPREADRHHRPSRRFGHDAGAAADELHLIRAILIGKYAILVGENSPATLGPEISNDQNQLTEPVDESPIQYRVSALREIDVASLNTPGELERTESLNVLDPNTEPGLGRVDGFFIDG